MNEYIIWKNFAYRLKIEKIELKFEIRIILKIFLKRIRYWEEKNGIIDYKH